MFIRSTCAKLHLSDVCLRSIFSKYQKKIRGVNGHNFNIGLQDETRKVGKFLKQVDPITNFIISYRHMPLHPLTRLLHKLNQHEDQQQGLHLCHHSYSLTLAIASVRLLHNNQVGIQVPRSTDKQLLNKVNSHYMLFYRRLYKF